MRTLFTLVVVLLLGGCATAPQQDRLPDRKDPDRAAALNLQLGIEYMKRGEFETALKKLNHALELDPDYAEAHNVLGVLYARLGEKAKAEQHFRRSVSIAPKASSLLNNYGLFLCREGRVEEAEGLFNKALDNPLYTTPEIALTNAGTCHLDHGDAAKGEAYFRRALAINPGFAPALLKMAQISAQGGHYAEARGYLERYEQTGAPHDPESLRLAISIARGLGDSGQAARYERMLRSGSPRAAPRASDGGRE
ncbi:MAG: type IV pilus biogenesis/stability protein PilW [Gammaproteobacteria bacterium]|nr:MAG: type IV pilus biogenesis/stability protein PilW [Gammaproteobacteria bacterium]